MLIDVITLFPDMIKQASAFGIAGRALERGLWRLHVWNPRDFATDAYKTIDDRPYGGGPGMVMMAAPLSRALAASRDAQRAAGAGSTKAIYLSPAGTCLSHAIVAELAAHPDVALTLVAGRYEGIDQRFVDREIDCELSIGDFVVSGGELPALLLIDAIVRQLPTALNDARSAVQESFADGLLDCPHYTRPEELDGARVPAVLLSGDHAAIRRWRLKQSLGRTRRRRPELIARRALSADEEALLAEYEVESTHN